MNYFVQIIFLFISIYSLYIAPTSLNRPYMLANCILAFVSIYSCYCHKEKNPLLKGQYLRHSALFLISYIVVFYQYFIDYSIGLITTVDTTSTIGRIVWYNESLIPTCLAISNIGLNMFLLGYMFRKSKGIMVTSVRKKYEPRNINILTCLNFILIFLYVATINKDYLFNGYGKGLEMGETATRISGYLIPSICSQVAIQTYLLKKEVKNISVKTFISKFKAPFFMIMIMTGLILLSGRRTDAVLFLSVLLLAYLIVSKRPIKIRYILPVVLGLSILMFVISEVRRDNGTSSNEAIEMLGKNNTTISPITQELAFNCSSLEIAMTDIPKKVPYLNGLTWVDSFISAIPAGPTVIGSFISIPLMFQKSDNLITILALGRYEWGLGTSILADIYVNFGIAGIIVLMFLFGSCLRYLEEKSFSTNCTPYIIGVSLVVYSSLIYMTRGSIWTPIGPVAYVFLLIWIFTKKQIK